MGVTTKYTRVNEVAAGVVKNYPQAMFGSNELTLADIKQQDAHIKDMLSMSVADIRNKRAKFVVTGWENSQSPGEGVAKFSVDKQVRYQTAAYTRLIQPSFLRPNNPTLPR